jgi:tRNA pseudouridine65 synthase
LTPEILYQDEHLVAVRKPPGIHVHRTQLTPGEAGFTEIVETFLNKRVFPVHRLDRPTSGLLVFALDSASASVLGRHWRERVVEKVYHAVLRGWLEEPLSVEKPVRRERKEPATLDAKTLFTPLELWEPPWPRREFTTLRLSLVEIRPYTGRRHQIRQHARDLFHPVLGDTIWGDTALNNFVRERSRLDRLCLFCRRLSFPHPVTGKLLFLEAPATESELLLFESLRGNETERDEKSFINSFSD